MIFTDGVFFVFFACVFLAYWLVRARRVQNLILLVGSYVFYGWIHPWFCILIAVSTVVDFTVGLAMHRRREHRRAFLLVSLVTNLGMLGFFKYFNFFAENVHQLASGLGLNLDPVTLKIFLPVGISFYTFQTLSYTIDIYRRRMEPRTSFLDFALFVAFFPQLVAGPIERAKRFLPQIESPRRWRMDLLYSAWPLIVMGYLKKIVVADNVAVFVNKVYMLEQPSLLLLTAGTLAFTVQIFADFSAYTDLARGFARLLGFDLVQNFNHPYLAVSPSDFWRRWHISFSSWIRDYLYIPLGGSRVDTKLKFLLVTVTAMGLSGLWHGAAWHFVAWGVYHALLVFAYHQLGLGGRWKPTGPIRTLAAWAVMFAATNLGWMLFRAPSMAWLLGAFRAGRWGWSGDSLTAAMAILAMVLLYSLPLLVLPLLERWDRRVPYLMPLYCAAAVCAVIVFLGTGGQDFIYFQF
jgi:D-alanyl-lipoteichoic acid acyltransferase DltB (MBOAT superfamily)